MSQLACSLPLVVFLAALVTANVSAAATPDYGSPDFGKRGDLAWGFADFAHPDSKEVGARSLTVLVRNSRLDQQTRATSRPRSGKIRIELQYKRRKESWQVDPTRAHAVIPLVQSSSSSAEQGGTISKLSAVLPQRNQRNQIGQFGLPQLNVPELATGPRSVSPLYSRNPIKFRPGETVEYRWVIVRDSGKLARSKWRVGKFRMPPPYSVAMMGDSFGSGEGAPTVYKKKMRRPSRHLHIAPLLLSPIPAEDKFVGDFARWSDRQAHRSRYSGFVQGLKKFKEEKPEVWVEYIHTAISSATITPYFSGEKKPKAGGMYTKFVGSRELFVDPLLIGTLLDIAAFGDWGIIGANDNVQDSQLSQVERWQRSQGLNCVDVALLSASGNDTGFGKIIEAALRYSLQKNSDVIEEIVKKGQERAKPHVDQFFNELNDYAKPRTVYWATYPNLTRRNRTQYASLTSHPQTEDMGKKIVLAGLAGASIGGLIGAVTTPSPIITPDDVAWMAAMAGEALKLGNLNPVVLGMSAAISAGDLREAETMLVGKINPGLADWCSEQTGTETNSERGPYCRVITEIQNNAVNNGITAGDKRDIKSSPRSARWFNTFFDSTRYACGGMDCAVHPTRQGFERIYKQPVYDKLVEGYVDSVKYPRKCDALPPLKTLRNEWAGREAKAREIDKGADPDPPLIPGTPEEERKEIHGLLQRIHGSDRAAANEAIRAYTIAQETGRMTR